MSDKDLDLEADSTEEDFDLVTDETEDLEAAMKEALEAVERASHEGRNVTAEIELISAEDSLPESQRGHTSDDPDVARLEKEVAELKDRSIRTLADFDNYRKRVERDREEERRFAAMEAIREFVTVLDNLERAIASNGSPEDLRTGLELILRQMRDLLKSFGVTRVATTGEAFNPQYHEAVSRFEDSNVAVPTVKEELQPGYLFHERLLRPAVVRVAMPEAKAEETVTPSDPLQSDDSEVKCSND